MGILGVVAVAIAAMLIYFAALVLGVELWIRLGCECWMRGGHLVPQCDCHTRCSYCNRKVK